MKGKIVGTFITASVLPDKLKKVGFGVLERGIYWSLVWVMLSLHVTIQDDSSSSLSVNCDGKLLSLLSMYHQGFLSISRILFFASSIFLGFFLLSDEEDHGMVALKMDVLY